MASPKFSFIFVTPEEYKNCQKAKVGAGAIACHLRRMQAPS